MSTEVLPPEPAANPDLLGHDQAIATLTQALASGRLHHGWLIPRPPRHRQGDARLPLRPHPPPPVATGEPARLDLGLPSIHPVFAQVAGGHHPDLFVIEAERDPKTGKVKPQMPGRSGARGDREAAYDVRDLRAAAVLIVDGAEKLNRNAANALLKPLEEPPPGAVLILVSHRPGQVAATLRSRCAKLPMSGLDERTALTSLLERYAPGSRRPTRSADRRHGQGQHRPRA